MRDPGRSLTARGAAVPGARPGVWRSIPARLIPVGVVAAIASFVLIPVRQELIPKSTQSLKPLSFQPLPPRPRIPLAATIPAGWSRKVRTLILYDHSGKWGWLGELDATLTANLVGHFGTWKAEPISDYQAGQLDEYSATIYLGSDFNEQLPASFEDDVLTTSRPVIWVADNISELESRARDFRQLYGWQTSTLDHAAVPEVIYKGIALTRWTHNSDGIMGYAAIDRSRVDVLARAVRTNGSSFPWALRSRHLTYIGEMPFSYLSETDRYLAFADLLFNALAPQTRPRHRALLMLEDINPESNPHQLQRVGAYLRSQGVPFGFGVSPEYRDPEGHYGPPSAVALSEEPRVVSALRQLQRDGGVLVEHGYTHQWDGAKNPYDGVTGDDAEFYRLTETPDGQVSDLGPLPEDTSITWTEQRVVASERALEAAGFAVPKIFEFPDYTASARAYRAVAVRFPERWERSDYFAGLLTGGPVQYQHVEGQFFPYVVHDVYGSKVLPENLGGIAPSTWHSYKARLPQDLIRAARANLVVRDGFADFYFHPFLNIGYLKRTIRGITALGYSFVSPTSL